MKTAIIFLLSVICLNVYSQTKRNVSGINQNRTGVNTTTAQPTGNQIGNSNENRVVPRQTATDRYLNGPARSTSSGGRAAKSEGSVSGFAGGVHAAQNASKVFDTAAGNSANTANNQSIASTSIAGGNDTTFNVNTISPGGVTTTSGAVDRSGQAQFGQTNWGRSRGTVGESQWTIPPPVTASFNKEFPELNRATWSRNNADTTIFSAKYRVGAQWITTNYNASGQRLDTRTQFPLLQPPAPVSVFIAKQPPGFQAASIYKLQMQGRQDVYEIRTKMGKTIYVNNEGMEVNY